MPTMKDLADAWNKANTPPPERGPSPNTRSEEVSFRVGDVVEHRCRKGSDATVTGPGEVEWCVMIHHQGEPKPVSAMRSNLTLVRHPAPLSDSKEPEKGWVPVVGERVRIAKPWAGKGPKFFDKSIGTTFDVTDITASGDTLLGYSDRTNWGIHVDYLEPAKPDWVPRVGERVRLTNPRITGIPSTYDGVIGVMQSVMRDGGGDIVIPNGSRWSVCPEQLEPAPPPAAGMDELARKRAADLVCVCCDKPAVAAWHWQSDCQTASAGYCSRECREVDHPIKRKWDCDKYHGKASSDLDSRIAAARAELDQGPERRASVKRSKYDGRECDEWPASDERNEP